MVEGGLWSGTMEGSFSKRVYEGSKGTDDNENDDNVAHEGREEGGRREGARSP